MASISAMRRYTFFCDVPSLGLVMGSVGCSTVLFSASAAVVTQVWGALPPTKCSLGVLFVPAFGGGLDMSVVSRLSICDLGF